MKFINRVFEYKYLFTIFISILLSFTFGINFWEYTIYNFDKLFLFENSSNYLLDPRIQMINDGAIILNIFNQIFKPLLQIPILYFISSILIKSAIIYMIYLITNALINNQRLSFVIALFFIVSPTLSYYVPNGFFGGTIFFRASLSGLFTLMGIYFLIKDKFYFSIIPFILSLHLHVLFGITAFTFIFCSFLFYAMAIASRDLYKKLLFLTVIMGINILIIISMMDYSSFNIVSSNIESWYKYIFTNDPDDVSIFYVLGINGYFVLPFIFFSLYLYYKNQEKKIVDYLFMGSFILFTIIIVIEVLHYNSIFFGVLSEKFIAIQFRRALWIVWLFSTIINFVYIQKLIDEGTKEIGYSLISVLFLYLYPNLFILILLSLLYSFFFKKIKFLYILLLSLVVIYISNYLHLLLLIKPYFIFAFNIISTLIIGVLYYKNFINRKNILLIIVMSYLLMSAGMGLLRGSLKNDFEHISNRGLFHYPDIVELEEELQKTKGINYKIIHYIREHNVDKNLIFAPLKKIHYGSPIIYGAPLYISRYTLGMPIFNKIFYENLLYKVKILNIEESQLFQKRSNVEDLIDSEVLLLSKSRIKLLYDKYKVKFLITRGEFIFMNPIIKENNYNLYDLSKLKD